MDFPRARADWRGRRTRGIADHGVCRSREGIIGLSFDEGMVYYSGRALQGLRRSVPGIECPSIDRAEEVPGLWISDGGLWYVDGDQPGWAEAACGRSDHRLRRNADDKTDDGGGNRAVLERGNAVGIGRHAYVILLARRSERVPHHPPP